MRKLKTLFILVACLFVTWASLAADDSAGKALDVKLNIISGQVKLTRVGKTFADVLTTGVPLFPGDLIETMRESKAELCYSDGAVMRLKPQTLVEIQPFSLKIFKGKVWHKFTKRGTEFVIDTPSLVAGIRGTIFDVAVSSRGKTILSVMEGAVAVTGKGSKSKRFFVKAGYSTHADPGEDPVAPYKFNVAQKNSEWLESEWISEDRSIDQLFINYLNLKNEYGENDPRTLEVLKAIEEAKKAKSSENSNSKQLNKPNKK